MRIAIVGGTGKEGRGLALRFARAGHEVRIGSRDAERARARAAELTAEGRGAVAGGGNEEVTAASELARNTLRHGGGGTVRLEALNDDRRRGLRLVFEDRGPGIADIQLALKDGYSTGGGLGLGLGGAKRLANEFAVSSRPGEGTRVTITRWK